MSVFKAYDIRGLYPSQIHEDLVYRVGYHFAQFLGEATGPIVVGRDIRPSSVPLSERLEAGIRDAGWDVTDLGLATTPMVYFATHTLGARGGIMVTASHNPAGYNGLKLCREEAIPVGSASGLDDIRQRIERGAAMPVAARRGSSSTHDILPAFRAFLHKEAHGLPRLKVAIDTANGTVGPFVDRLLEGLPLDIVPLFFEPDGTFPNHEANPLKLENLRDLQKAVTEQGCALGIAFDGDGDRAAVVDERGRPVSGDIMTALIARRVLEKTKGPVLYDLRSSRCVREEIERMGGRPVETRVGHAFIKAAMRKEGGLFAGELSGHYYFRENACAEEAFLAAIRVMQIMGETQKRLSVLCDELDRYPRTGEVNFEVEDKDGAIKRIEDTFRDAQEIYHLDGVTIRYPRWWANIRKSNTEPLLRLNLEADDAEELARVRALIIEAIGAPPEHP